MREEVRPGRRDGAGWLVEPVAPEPTGYKGSTSGVHGRARLKAVGARARAERTQNIQRMSVTLDVSKLSGWLNADAYCGVERRACDAGRGAAREA